MITIVGGGTAGLITALILNQRLSDKIRVIKSDKIGIIGVGEGSTEHWSHFMKAINLDSWELIRKTDATCKLGIYFKDWTEKPYYNNITNFHEIKIAQFPIASALNYVNDKDQVKMTDYHTIDSKVENRNLSPSKQYHFNAFKLNDYLLEKCSERGVEIIDDEIVDVNINEDGIKNIVSKTKIYDSEFFIDCTGFKRLLISKLGAKWVSYSKYLKLNEAIAFPTGDTDEYTPYTIATAMKNGWMWRAPVWGRHGNGYIFNNEFTNSEEAKKEVEQHLGYEIKIVKNVKFEPGALDRPWIKNCMAVGLSANFVEPLEASAIATTINQTFAFTNHYFPNNEKEISKFNSKMQDIMMNIRDYICLHYITKREDTNFWKQMKKVELPESLKENLEAWKYRMAISDDFKSRDYLLFKESNFNAILYGLGILDKNSIKKTISKYDKSIIDFCQNKITEYENNLDELAKTKYVSHKKWLHNAREKYISTFKYAV